jgi:hypothetical protein
LNVDALGGRSVLSLRRHKLYARKASACSNSARLELSSVLVARPEHVADRAPKTSQATWALGEASGRPRFTGPFFQQVA